MELRQRRGSEEVPPARLETRSAERIPRSEQKLVASLPLTGSFSVPGEFHQQGYELCVDTINANGGLLHGRQVELKVSDNQSDPETVALQTDRFISVDDADILLGTFSTLLSFPASAVAERAQMVYPEPSDSSLQSHSRGLKYNFGFTLKPINYIGQTPVDETHTRLSFSILTRARDRSEPEVAAALRRYIDDNVRTLEQDFPIWENKIYREHPLLCEADGPILKFRRWAAQFYPA